MRPIDTKKTKHPGVKKVGSDTYLVRVKVNDPRTGRPRQAERLVNGSLPEAVAARMALRSELLSEATQAASRTRLSDYAFSWLNGKKNSLKFSTLERYGTALALHIVPVLGDLYMDAIVPADVSRWRDAQRDAPRTVNGRLRVLKTMFRDAVADLDLLRDPTARIKALAEPPSYDDKDPNLVSPEEVHAVVLASREICPTHYPVIATLAFTGMRIGEALALRWSDIDRDAGLIRIQSAQYRQIVGTTKTGKIRTVPLLPEHAAILDEHRRTLLRTQAPGARGEWVFPSETGRPRFSSTLRKPLAKAVAAAKLSDRLTPHGFRRSFNDALRRHTTSTVQRALTGHSTVQMSEHYSHVGIGEKRTAVASVFALPVRTSSSTVGADSGADDADPSKLESRSA